MKLTKNFSKSEFESKDGAVMPFEVFENIKELARNLQVIREFVGSPLKLTNAYRSLEHNRNVGSSDTSQHPKGKAGDIQSKELTPLELYNIIIDLISVGEIKEGGVGLYNSFVHYDIYYDGVNKRRWDNTTH